MLIMDSPYLYLTVNILTIFFPLLLSFDKKVRFFRTWGALFPAIILTYIFMIVWDHYFTLAGIWQFSSEHIIGINIYNLPIEEHLFFITVPFSCLFIYECLRIYFPANYLRPYSLYINIVVLIVSIMMVFFHWDKLYTAVSFLCCSFLLFQHLFIWRTWRTWQGFFWFMYIVSLIPLFIVNGILTSIPVVIYNNTENLGIRMGTIPVEDLSYHLFTVLSVTTLLEWFRNKKKTKSTLKNQDFIPIPE